MNPNKIRYSAQYSVTNDALERMKVDELIVKNRYIIPKLVEQVLRAGLAPRVEGTLQQDRTTWRVDLIICSPDEFERIVERRVNEMNEENEK